MVKPFRDEYEFTAEVIKLALRHGWKVVRVPRMKGRDGGWHTPQRLPGWPDLLLFRAPQILALELKMPGNQLSAAQRQVLAELQRCTIPLEAWTVWPRDMATIEDILATPASPARAAAHARLAGMDEDEIAAFLAWATPTTGG